MKVKRTGHPYKRAPYYQYVKNNMQVKDVHVKNCKYNASTIYKWLSGQSGCPDCDSQEKVVFSCPWHSDIAECPVCDFHIIDPFLLADFPL